MRVKVSGDLPLRFSAGLGLLDHQDRTVGSAQHLFRHTSRQEALQAVPSMTAEDNQVAVALGRGLDDGLHGVVLAQDELETKLRIGEPSPLVQLAPQALPI